MFEIKSSTGPKDHFEDICFQKVVVERCGTVVRSVHLIHVNKDYVRLGEIDCSQLLTIVDATADAQTKWDEIEAGITEALDLLGSDEIDEAGCSCRVLGNFDNHCASFAHFNRDLPEISAHVLPRISKQKLAKLDAEGRLAIHALTEADLTVAQLPAWTAITTGQPLINRGALQAFLDRLAWPIHFYDYETFKSAVPLSDGHRPHVQIPVQFSLHRLHEDGRLEHFEFLCDAPGKSRELAEYLAECISADGAALVWFETFEKTCNKTLAQLHPELAEFFATLSERTVDLMVPFQKDYVHPDFRGSASIKKVLPVVCDLSYEGMPVHDGTGAMEAWAAMVAEVDEAARKDRRKALLAYCELDTFAMVRVPRVPARTGCELTGPPNATPIAATSLPNLGVPPPSGPIPA